MAASKREFDAQRVAHKKYVQANQELYEMFAKYQQGDDSVNGHLNDKSEENQ